MARERVAKRVCLWTIVGALVSVGGLQATPIQWAGNGHYYEVRDAGSAISWTEAKGTAETLSWVGLQGHLASITSEAENVFIRDLLPSQPFTFPAVWIGGYQPAGSAEPDGGWCWVTNEPWAYSNWSANEPNDSSPGEGFLEIYAHQGDWWGMWNDNQDSSSYNNTKYVVEYEGEIPEPSTIVLLGLAGAALTVRKRLFGQHEID